MSKEEIQKKIAELEKQIETTLGIRKTPSSPFGDNVIYDGRSIKIKDEKALLEKAQAICDQYWKDE